MTINATDHIATVDSEGELTLASSLHTEIDFSVENTLLSAFNGTDGYILYHNQPLNGLTTYKSIYTEDGSPPDDFEVTWATDTLTFNLKAAGITSPSDKGRIQLDIFSDTPELLEVKRIKLLPALAPLKDLGSITWFVVSEIRSGLLGVDDHRFRVVTDLINVNDDLYLAFHSSTISPVDAGEWQTLWSAPVVNAPLPIDEWFNLRTYYRVGDEDTGRFKVEIQFDGESYQTLCDVHDRTYNASAAGPLNIKHNNPFKVYTSKATIDFLITNAGSAAMACNYIQTFEV